MKTCNRCGYSGGGQFHQVKGFDLCEDCYAVWLSVRKDAFLQFLGTKVRVEMEMPKLSIKV